MYRRIRRLYDELGVGGRAELMSLAAVLDLSRPPTARLVTPRPPGQRAS